MRRVADVQSNLRRAVPPRYVTCPPPHPVLTARITAGVSVLLSGDPPLVTAEYHAHLLPTSSGFDLKDTRMGIHKSYFEQDGWQAGDDVDDISGTFKDWKNKGKGWASIKWDGDDRGMTVDLGELLKDKWGAYIMTYGGSRAGNALAGPTWKAVDRASKVARQAVDETLLEDSSSADERSVDDDESVASGDSMPELADLLSSGDDSDDDDDESVATHDSHGTQVVPESPTSASPMSNADSSVQLSSAKASPSTDATQVCDCCRLSEKTRICIAIMNLVSPTVGGRRRR